MTHMTHSHESLLIMMCHNESLWVIHTHIHWLTIYYLLSMTEYQPVLLSTVETIFFDESWWVMVSHDQSLWVMMSHTYVYLLADHIISTLTGFTTWLKSQPRFEMTEFHKKWIQNGKCYRNIYVSTYIAQFHHTQDFQWRNTNRLYYPRL